MLTLFDNFIIKLSFALHMILSSNHPSRFVWFYHRIILRPSYDFIIYTMFASYVYFVWGLDCNEYLFSFCCLTGLDENWGEIEPVRRYCYNILFIRTKLNIPRWVNKTYMNTRRIGWGEKNQPVRTTLWDGREWMSSILSLCLFLLYLSYPIN